MELEEYYFERIKCWRKVYRKEVKEKGRGTESIGSLHLEDYVNVERPFFSKLFPEDKEYVRTFRMISYGMLQYSPSMRSIILRGAGRKLAHKLVEERKIRELEDLPLIFLEQKIGLLDIIDESLNTIKVNIYECISCYQAPKVGRALCDFEAGLIQGVIEEIIGRNTTKELYCWGLGNSFCGFEVVLL